MPRMSAHGTPGQSCSPSLQRRTAASLIFCSSRSTAEIVFSSLLKATRSIPATNRSIFSILATISRNGAEGFLKGKYRLSFGPLPDRFLERLGRGQIDGNNQQVLQ